MRTKEDLLNDLGVNREYNPHGGKQPDTKDFVLIEALIDIRDQIKDLVYLIGVNMDTDLRESLKTAGLWPE